MLAIFWNAASRPGVSSQVHCLFNIGLEIESVPSAFRTTYSFPVFTARVLLLAIIIDLQELGRGPIINIVVNRGVSKVLFVGLDVNPEDTIVRLGEADLFL